MPRPDMVVFVNSALWRAMDAAKQGKGQEAFELVEKALEISAQIDIPVRPGAIDEVVVALNSAIGASLDRRLLQMYSSARFRPDLFDGEINHATGLNIQSLYVDGPVSLIGMQKPDNLEYIRKDALMYGILESFALQLLHTCGYKYDEVEKNAKELERYAAALGFKLPVDNPEADSVSIDSFLNNMWKPQWDKEMSKVSPMMRGLHVQGNYGLLRHILKTVGLLVPDLAKQGFQVSQDSIPQIGKELEPLVALYDLKIRRASSYSIVP